MSAHFPKFSPWCIFPVVLILPFLFYLFVCRDFVCGLIPISGDTAAHYTFTKYFINNLANGVMPLWEPFTYAGRPFLALINGGMLSPFIFLIWIGTFIGLTYYQAYIVFILFYFFLGALGFYVLSREVLKSDFYAFLAYAALLFSGIGLMVFNQIYLLFIFVPSMWFAAFLVRFVRRFQKSDFLGVFFSAIIMELSYYPFYLLTVCIVFALVFALFYVRRLKFVFVRTLGFLKANPWCFVFCFLAIIIASMPLFMYKMRDSRGEMIAPVRHPGCTPPGSYKDCFEGGQLRFAEVGTFGTLGERVSFAELFANLDKHSYMVDDFFYIPIFCLIWIFLGLFTPMDRLKKVVLFSTFLIFLISLGCTSPVHQFLFDHVFYFQYFRNFFFFMAYLIPLIVLFAVIQLRSIIKYNPQNRLRLAVLVVLLHIGFFMMAQSQGDLIQSSYVVILGSLVFFVPVIYGFKRPSMVLCVLILLLIQPVQVWIEYKKDASIISDQLFTDHVLPQFKFQRPDDSRSHGRIFRFRDFDFESNLTMSDSDGRFMTIPDSVSLWHFLLMTQKDSSAYLSYIGNKFYLYDSVRFYNLKDLPSLSEVKKSFTPDAKSAYVFDSNLPEGEFKDRKLSGSVNSIVRIPQETESFKVRKFTVNEISVDYRLDTSKFLVYTDSFSSDWQGSIDGKKEAIYRANGAAKGMFLPAGQHSFKMVYIPFPGVGMNWFVLIFMTGYLLILVSMLIKENTNTKHFDASHSLRLGFSPRRGAGNGGLLGASAFFYVFILAISFVSIDTEMVHVLRLKHLKTCLKKTYDKTKAQIVYDDYLRRSQKK